MSSGGLWGLWQVYDYEYDLILRPDINTRGHTQWFYFSVSNTIRNVPYKFNIINMVIEPCSNGAGPQSYSPYRALVVRIQRFPHSPLARS